MQQRSGRPRRRWLGGAIAALGLGALALTPVQTGYHDYDSLTGALRDLAGAHDETATLVSIGESREGRDIWALEIAAPGPLPAADRPALLVVGSLEADRLIGSELALSMAREVLARSGSDPAVRAQLEQSALYVVPRANPDGAERMFASVRSDFRTTLRPADDDADGRVDEDGPEDLNGDGVITLMRVAEPGGPYRVDPSDARLLREADAARGESGSYELYVEGTDDDGDGFYNEDGPGGVDLGRNFQHAYPYYAPDAGPHMVSEPESRALMDYVLAHRNIAAILTFGASDNLVGDLGPRGDAPTAAPLALPGYPAVHVEEARGVGMVERPRRPYGYGYGMWGGQGRAAGDAGGARPAGRQPATTVDEADREYYATIAERYRELTGIRTLANTRAPEGAFHDFGYFQFGVPSFSTPGWGLDVPAAGEGADEGEQAAGADARMLEWLDDAGVDGFVAWTPYEHPELGPVEIGGFRPYTTTNPPADRIPELGAAHADFALYLASLFPRVRIVETGVTAHGGGLYAITAEVENQGYLPTSLAQGVTADAVAPTMVQLGIDPGALVTGDAVTSFFPALDGSGARRSYTWLVRGRPGQEVELRVVAEKAGRDATTLTLR